MAKSLAKRLGLSDASSITELCDALIVSALGMSPGKLTLARIRANILATRVHAAAKAISGTSLQAAQGDALVARPGTLGPSGEAPAQRGGSNLQTSPLPPPVSGRSGEAPDLLEFVRETLTEIGDEGRFGDEKVFVSVLWHELAHRGPPADLSLDHFKQWLVTANRNRWLTLARADVVGAMDPKKVRESEIQDRGATFHFVLDPNRNPAAQQGRTHVR